MASQVYFARLKAGSDGSAIARVQQLFDAAQFDHLVTADAPTAIKLHFGERGNDSYVRPTFVRQVVDKIKACGGKPFITCLLYTSPSPRDRQKSRMPSSA